MALDAGHSRKVRGFTGHEHLDRTGFIHMNGRVYDPLLGRFLSPDPLVQFPTFSQSWNRYSYLNNTPTSFTDPTGYTIDEIEVTGSMGSLSGFGATLHAWNSLSVSNGGGVGGGGIGADRFNGAGATAPSETELAEADDTTIDEIVVTASRTYGTGVAFHGVGSAIVYMGTSASYAFFGLFDEAGGAGVVAKKLQGTSPLASAATAAVDAGIAIGEATVPSGLVGGALVGATVAVRAALSAAAAGEISGWVAIAELLHAPLGGAAWGSALGGFAGVGIALWGGVWYGVGTLAYETADDLGFCFGCELYNWTHDD